MVVSIYVSIPLKSHRPIWDHHLKQEWISRICQRMRSPPSHTGWKILILSYPFHVHLHAMAWCNAQHGDAVSIAVKISTKHQPIGTASCLVQTPPQSIPGPSPMGHPWRSSAAAERVHSVLRQRERTVVLAKGEKSNRNSDAETLMVYGMQ